jgi:hypothetical protein
MSPAAWMRQQRDRPLAEHERRTALVATAIVLIAAALGFASTRSLTPNTQARAAATKTAAAPTAPDPRTPTPESSTGGELSSVAVRTSRAFLAGYLAYTSGHAPANRITDASGSLLVALAAHPPRVSPAMRSEHPRVVELHGVPAPAGEVGMSAVVNGGGLIDYTLGLILAPQDGRLLVTSLEQS